ncbi:hypothetical protein [Afipia carboxidovorans]|jgi:hypothetical protein|uniref:hypothetical protein n=1 Tax=Afipia carboxidovorans TaxID=40137 RepID=UPI00308B3865|nr:hypothetical protein CRBSH125_36330 [Afipia carboxidovorans]
MNDNFPWPIAGKPLSAESVLIEIDDTITEEGEEIAPNGPPWEPSRILEIVRRRVQFIVDNNGCLYPEDHVARKMLTISFIKSRMKAHVDDLDRRFIGYAIVNDEVVMQFRAKSSRFMGNNPESRITGVIIPDDDGEPIVATGMKF